MKKLAIICVFLLNFAIFVPKTDAFKLCMEGNGICYGGVVLDILDYCDSGAVVLLIGPPSPAIVMYQLPITQPKAWWLAMIPGQYVLGNAFLEGLCVHAEFDYSYYVPTAFYIGSTLVPPYL